MKSKITFVLLAGGGVVFLLWGWLWNLSAWVGFLAATIVWAVSVFILYKHGEAQSK